MLATIAEMDAMVGTTLEFARDEAVSEARRPTDLTALLQSIVDDMADAGLPVTMEPAEPVVYECRPAALKRALTQPDRQCGQVRQERHAPRSTRRRERSKSRSMTRVRDSGTRALARLRTVLSCRRIAKPGDRRSRARAGDCTFDCAGARRRTHTRQSIDRRPARQRKTSAMKQALPRKSQTAFSASPSTPITFPRGRASGFRPLYLSTEHR